MSGYTCMRWNFGNRQGFFLLIAWTNCSGMNDTQAALFQYMFGMILTALGPSPGKCRPKLKRWRLKRCLSYNLRTFMCTFYARVLTLTFVLHTRQQIHESLSLLNAMKELGSSLNYVVPGKSLCCRSVRAWPHLFRWTQERIARNLWSRRHSASGFVSDKNHGFLATAHPRRGMWRHATVWPVLWGDSSLPVHTDGISHCGTGNVRRRFQRKSNYFRLHMFAT